MTHNPPPWTKEIREAHEKQDKTPRAGSPRSLTIFKPFHSICDHKDGPLQPLTESKAKRALCKSWHSFLQRCCPTMQQNRHILGAATHTSLLLFLWGHDRKLFEIQYAAFTEAHINHPHPLLKLPYLLRSPPKENYQSRGFFSPPPSHPPHQDFALHLYLQNVNVEINCPPPPPLKKKPLPFAFQLATYQPCIRNELFSLFWEKSQLP